MYSMEEIIPLLTEQGEAIQDSHTKLLTLQRDLNQIRDFFFFPFISSMLSKLLWEYSWRAICFMPVF